MRTIRFASVIILIALVAFVALVAAAPPASANEYELGIATGTRWLGSSGNDALANEDGHTVVALTGALGLTGLSVGGFTVEADASYERGEQTGTTFQRVHSELTMQTWLVGGRLRKQLAPRLSAFGRFGLGYTTASLRLEDWFGATRPVSDRAHAATSALSVGVDLGGLKPRKRSRFSIGVRAELEYARTTALGFSAEPEAADDGTLTIPTMATSLGDVDASGWSARIGIYGRF